MLVRDLRAHQTLRFTTGEDRLMRDDARFGVAACKFMETVTSQSELFNHTRTSRVDFRLESEKPISITRPGYIVACPD